MEGGFYIEGAAPYEAVHFFLQVFFRCNSALLALGSGGRKALSGVKTDLNIELAVLLLFLLSLFSRPVAIWRIKVRIRIECPDVPRYCFQGARYLSLFIK